MKEQDLFKALEELAQRLDIEVRYETVQGEEGLVSGGLCRLHGRLLLILNPTAPLRDKTDVLARAVKRFDLNRVYLVPALRDFLEGLP